MKLWFFSSLFFSLVLAGCGERSFAPLKVGIAPWLGYEPFYLAKQQGYFGSSNIYLVELASATDVMRALQVGSLQAATLRLSESISLMSLDVDLSVVSVLGLSKGADLVVSKQPLASSDKIKGLRVGVEMTTAGAILLHKFLEKGGLTVNDVQIVSLKNNRQVEAFRNNEVDIVVTYEPVAGALIKGGGYKIFGSESISPPIIDVLVVRKDAMSAHQIQIQQLVNGYYSAHLLMRDQEAEAFAEMALRSGVGEDIFKVAYKGIDGLNLEESRIWLSACGKFLGRRAEQLSMLMMRKNLIKDSLFDFGICDDSWVRAVAL